MESEVRPTSVQFKKKATIKNTFLSNREKTLQIHESLVYL